MCLVANLCVIGEAWAHCDGNCVCTCPEHSPIERTFGVGRWTTVETANFRVHSDARETVAPHVARHAECLRNEFAAVWLESNSAPQWSVKCEIFVHTHRASYMAAVGRGGERTIGASLINQKQGRITGRRIDLVADSKNYLAAALPHELTHVVLADRFPLATLPRWADEGIALLCDPTEKQARHRAALHIALHNGELLAVGELLSLDAYPAGRWSAFYGQSASLAAFLMERAAPANFLRFLERAAAAGYDEALLAEYGIRDVAELDRLWRRYLEHPTSP
jgi:hypothetical protein